MLLPWTDEWWDKSTFVKCRTTFRMFPTFGPAQGYPGQHVDKYLTVQDPIKKTPAELVDQLNKFLEPHTEVRMLQTLAAERKQWYEYEKNEYDWFHFRERCGKGAWNKDYRTYEGKGVDKHTAPAANENGGGRHTAAAAKPLGKNPGPPRPCLTMPYVQLEEIRMEVREWTQNNRMLQGGTHFPLCVKFTNVGRRSESAVARRLEKDKPKKGWGANRDKGRRLGPLSSDACKHCNHPSHASDDCPMLKMRGNSWEAWEAVAQRAATRRFQKDLWDSSDFWGRYVPRNWGTAPAAHRTSGDWGTAPADNGGWSPD